MFIQIEGMQLNKPSFVLLILEVVQKTQQIVGDKINMSGVHVENVGN